MNDFDSMTIVTITNVTFDYLTYIESIIVSFDEFFDAIYVWMSIEKLIVSVSYDFQQQIHNLWNSKIFVLIKSLVFNDAFLKTRSLNVDLFCFQSLAIQEAICVLFIDLQYSIVEIVYCVNKAQLKFDWEKQHLFSILLTLIILVRAILKHAS